MNTIQRYAKILTSMSIVFAVLVVIGTCAPWLHELFPAALWKFFPSNTIQDALLMPLSHRLMALFVSCISLAILCRGIIVFNRLMQSFYQGELFSQATAQQLHTLSKVALAWAVYTPIQSTLLGLITTLHHGIGKKMITLSISFGTHDMINLMVFGAFVLATGLIQEGSKLKQEQDLTV